MFNATPQQQQESAQAINQWLYEGKLLPHVSTVLPLAQAAEAHQLQEANTLRQSGKLSGKIILRP